jgi:hypothetical protein
MHLKTSYMFTCMQTIMNGQGQTKTLFVPMGKASELTGLEAQTIRKMADKGLLECYKTPSGQRRINTQSIQQFCAPIVPDKEKLDVQKQNISMLGSVPESKWTTFLDNLNSSEDPSTLAIQLFRILGQELTSRDAGFRPFWNPAYKELSEKLLLPTGTL